MAVFFLAATRPASARGAEHVEYPRSSAEGRVGEAMEDAVNVYAIDDQGRVHDVAYDLHADDARAMAKTISGGVAAAERPAEKKPAKSAD